MSFLREVGAKIVPIYDGAFKQLLNPDQTSMLIDDLAQAAAKRRFGDAGYKRLFVQSLVRGLGTIHHENRVPKAEDLMQGTP